MCPSPKGVVTHRLRTTALKRKEPKTRTTGRTGREGTGRL